MSIQYWITNVFILTVLPAVLSSIGSIILNARARKKQSSSNLFYPRYPIGLTTLEKFVWGFKGFYILWYSMFKKKRYVFKIHIEDYHEEIMPLRKFCNQHFHGLFAVEFGVLDGSARENYFHDIVHNITQVPAHVSPTPLDDPPPMYMNIKFLFEKDAMWFALHHGDKIV